MIPGSRSSFLLLSFLFLACASADATKKKKKQPIDPEGEFGFVEDDEPVGTPVGTTVVEDSGAYGAAERPAHTDAGPIAEPDASPPDAGPVTKTYCQGPLAAGDLVVTELMIASRAGSADDGEWVEIRSTRDCWLHLDGVTVESPRGTTSDVASLAAGAEIPPHGSFVAAGSADPVANHGVTGLVAAWSATDVLKNTGDTVMVKAGATVLDTLTYPAFSNLVPGRSLAFPSDCPAADRTDFQRWSLAFHAYAAGYSGTPNAANDDVACF